MKQFSFTVVVALISLTLVGCASTENTNESTTSETIEKNINIEELKQETEAAIKNLPVNEAVADEIRSITTGETTESSTSEATTSVEVENTTTETPTEEPIAEEENTSAGITIQDVATHDSSSDCWMVIDGGVYDVTSYISSHPGGSAILRGCGVDATSMFSGHSASADAIKANYKIGDLAQ